MPFDADAALGKSFQMIATSLEQAVKRMLL
jgi:hypothetical protein